MGRVGGGDRKRRRNERSALAAGALIATVCLAFLMVPWAVLRGAPVAASSAPTASATTKSSEERASRTPDPATPRSGLVETTGVSLTLLDVEVVDKDGKPMPGLGKDDFRVWLNGKEWPLYSVDDLCTCRPDDRNDAHDSAAANRAGTASNTKVREGKRPPPPHEAEDAGAHDRGSDAPVAAAPSRDGKRANATGDSASVSAAPVVAAGGSASVSAPAPVGGSDEDLRFVLYLDCSQLDLAGRTRAFNEAVRWVREVKTPSDQAAIVVRSESTGFREATPFTRNADELLRALASAKIDPALQDPWPAHLRERWEDCSGPGGETQCDAYAQQEAWRSTHSMEDMQRFLESLGEVPGRKALILFNTQGGLFPGRLYPIRRPDEVSDQLSLLEKVTAEATQSRTTVHTAYVGDWLAATPDAPWLVASSAWAVNLGSNLADGTGGTYSRDLSGLSAMTSRIRSRCACIYRLGLEPSAASRPGTIYQARVEVRGRPLDFRYRVEFLNDLDRWQRRAVAVLRHPNDATGVKVGGALVPGESKEDGWSLEVQVALDLGSLDFIPLPGGTGAASANWETGAILVREEDGRNWQMMTLGSARRPPGKRETLVMEPVVHTSLIEGLPPGSYKLSAFVRDTDTSAMGGAEARLVLPEPRKGKIAGPVLLLESRRHLAAPLPIWQKKRTGPGALTAARIGRIPSPGKSEPSGTQLVALSWVCPRVNEPHGPDERRPPLEVARYIAKDGKPIFRLPDPVMESAGACSRLVDILETKGLEAGTYTYQMELREGEAARPVTASATFTLDEPVTRGLAGGLHE